MLQTSLIPPRPYAQPVAARPGMLWPAVAVSSGLVVAVLILFCRAFWYGYSNVDDALYIYGEPNVSQGLSLSGLLWVFNDGPMHEWYPLTMLSHMLDCTVFGVDHPGGHHLVNVLIHATASVLLFLVLWRMTDQRAVPGTERSLVVAQASATTFWPSALVAALFAIHPLHVEPVVWLAERQDVLSALFFALTLGAYDEFTRHPDSRWRFPMVAALFGLGILSKPILVTMPALLLLLDFWPLGRFSTDPLPAASSAVRPRQPVWRLLFEKVPLAGLSLIAVIMMLRRHSTTPDSLTLLERVSNAIVSSVAYLGQMFAPLGLSVFYAHPETVRPLSRVLAALALLVVISVLAAIWYRKYPYFFVGWFWYLGMLVPVSGLVFVGTQARADRYTYLSQIGLYIALVWGAMELTARWPARRLALSIGSAVLLIVLAGFSWRQVGLWQTNRILWEHAVACSPKSATCHYQLGTVLQEEENDRASAGDQYDQAVELGPRARNIYAGARAEAHYRLGGMAVQAGNNLEAIGHLKKALESDPTFVQADLELGPLLGRQRGLLDEAIACFRRCIDRDPKGTSIVRSNLATALTVQGKDDEAEAEFKKTIEIDPKLAVAHLNYSVLLEHRGQIDEAVDELQQVITLEPDARNPYFMLARLLRHQGKNDEADEVDTLRAAADRRNAEALNKRGAELAEEGKYAEAIGLFQSAISTSPDFAQARLNMAAALEAQGDLNAAAVEYRRALQLDPNLTTAKEALARLQR